jgi:hypothetical protein
MSRKQQKKRSSTLKKTSVFNGLRSGLQIGMRLAFCFIRLNCIYCLCVVMSGCLVTDEITFDYEEENVPPVILDVKGTNTTIGDIIYFDVDMDVDSPSSIKFEFRVRDENIAQELLGRRKIYEQDAEEFFADDVTIGFKIAPSYQPIRNYEFEIDETTFNRNRCYRIYVVVTSDFKYDSDEVVLSNWNIPEYKDDIARASWYVVTGEETKCHWVTRYE